MPDKQKSAQKSRAHKESNHERRGARKVKLGTLEKFMISGKKPRELTRAGKFAQLHTEEKAKQEAREKAKKDSSNGAFAKLKRTRETEPESKLAGTQRRS